MKRIRLCAAGVLLLAAVVLGVRGWYYDSVRIPALKEAALEWYPVLSGHEFDSVGFSEENCSLALYRYFPAEPDSSVLSKTESARLQPGENCVFPFRDACSLDSGVFFADSIAWDGEWSGVYVSDAQLPDLLVPYLKRDLGDSVCYLEMVPDSIH